MAKYESPTAYSGQKATEDHWGTAKFADAVEAANVNVADMALSPKRLQTAVQALAVASTSNAGVTQYSTDAEAQAKTATDSALTPSNLAASGFLQYADVTITAAEIKAIETTPIELVAAPAAGSAHLFMGAQLKLNYGGSNAFTETDDNLVIKYENGSGVSVSDTIECTAFITATADTITNAVPVKDAIVAAASAEAKALVLYNPDDAIAGNAANDNTVTVRTYYVTQAL